MARSRKRDNGESGAGETGPGAGMTPDRAQSPVGTTPWAGAPWNQADASQQLMEALGPAAQIILQFEQLIVQGILEALAAAEASLQQLDSAIRVEIASQLTPAIM